MLIHLGLGRAILVSCLAWVLLGLTTGFFVHRLPLSYLSRDRWITRPRAWEDDGRFYEKRLRIRRWKDKLPEKGDLFRGGFSKRVIRDRSDGFLDRFAAETRRAELVHWMNAGSGPLFLIWCPWYLGLVMIGFGWIAHLPFIAIQRYNRARITRTLRRRGRLGARSAAPEAALRIDAGALGEPAGADLVPDPPRP
ncbi:MAG: hypothetical protein ACOYOP_09325 [Microthrixaceae bacterium]